MIKTFISFYIFAACFFFPLLADKTNEEAFSKIYQDGWWGKPGFSGGGSKVENAKLYMEYLENFLKSHEIRNVVDLGCGDWTFSRHIDWSNINYLGIDVVKSVIEKNQRDFTKDNIHFIQADVLNFCLPEADLLICKDVLQHLPIQDISFVLEQIGKFKYCLITNDIDLNDAKKNNLEILRGEYRSLDLTSYPFFLDAEKVLTYPCELIIKQVLLVKNSSLLLSKD